MAQNSEIDISHGNDAGIWVCEATGISISPCLFIQAICSERFPVFTSARWAQTGSVHKSFQKSGTLPLLYGEGGRVRPHENFIHLFSIEVPTTCAFEEESHLSDWQFPVEMAGIVVIVDEKYGDSISSPLNYILSALNLSAPSNRTLEWVKVQHLPFVIAAMGYDFNPNMETQFRQHYALAAHIPIVSGPALANPKPLKDKRRGMDAQSTGNFFETIFSGQRRIFDPEYAKLVLGTLCQLIENKQEQEIKHQGKSE
jgi:hypothetical protein